MLSPLSGLDAPLHQYAFSEWHMSGLELLQLTSADLERYGVHKIGHQELILEAVEKLCSLVCVRCVCVHDVTFAVVLIFTGVLFAIMLVCAHVFSTPN